MQSSTDSICSSEKEAHAAILEDQIKKNSWSRILKVELWEKDKFAPTRQLQNSWGNGHTKHLGSDLQKLRTGKKEAKAAL